MKHITLAKEDNIKKYTKYVDKILKAFGHTDALVTDETIIMDFISVFLSKEEQVVELTKAERKLGFDLYPDELLWKSAQRLSKRKGKSYKKK